MGAKTGAEAAAADSRPALVTDESRDKVLTSESLKSFYRNEFSGFGSSASNFMISIAIGTQIKVRPTLPLSLLLSLGKSVSRSG